MSAKSVVRDPPSIQDALRVAVTANAGGPGRCASFERMGVESSVADATTKWLVRDAAREPNAVILCSSPAAPGLIARGVERARTAKLTLGAELGRVILDPLCTGEVDGCSYVALPYRRPFSDAWLQWRWQRARLRPRVLEWLRGVARASVRPAEDVRRDFEAALLHMAEHAALDRTVCASARTALERLRSGAWPARHVLAHNDLWLANLLRGARGPEGPEPFVVIDWPGSWAKGYGIYDLVRLSDSIACKAERLRAELLAHCRILECEPVDARSHLLVALGAQGLHLEHFPLEAYRRMVTRSIALLEGAGL